MPAQRRTGRAGVAAGGGAGAVRRAARILHPPIRLRAGLRGLIRLAGSRLLTRLL